MRRQAALIHKEWLEALSMRTILPFFRLLPSSLFLFC
jgi:hypothetical protein